MDRDKPREAELLMAWRRGNISPAQPPESNGPCACDETHGFSDKPGGGVLVHCRRCGTSWPLENASTVIAEAMIADAVRTDAPRAPTTRLPDDSAERKRIPLCTGLLDYFPTSLCNVFEALEDGEDDWCTEPNWILGYLASRDYTNLLGACLDALQDELCEPPLGPRSRNAVERWGAALIAVAQVSVYGNEKHNPGQPLHHARGKSMDHADCIARHTFDAGRFDGPMRHSACRAWRAGALGQEAAEADGAPLAKGALLP